MPTSATWADGCRELARRLREHCLRMTHRGHSGHVGSMLSMAEILSVLYTRVLNVDPGDPRKRDRDRFVLSKGHGGCAVYAVLGELGFFPKAWFEGWDRVVRVNLKSVFLCGKYAIPRTIRSDGGITIAPIA